MDNIDMGEDSDLKRILTHTIDDVVRVLVLPRPSMVLAKVLADANGRRRKHPSEERGVPRAIRSCAARACGTQVVGQIFVVLLGAIISLKNHH
jgi:hypothetical protein